MNFEFCSSKPFWGRVIKKICGVTLYASGIHILLNTTISCLISVLAYGLAALPQTVAVAGLCIQEKRYLYVYKIMIKKRH